ncbi:MAG: alpha/beta hydrolase [Deltaproteobacteria bacterium]
MVAFAFSFVPAARPRLSAALTLALGSSLATSSLALDRQEGTRVPKLRWALCGEESPGVECASAEVPLDYDRPQGATINLALARVPAADPAHKLGTLFVNPGGPGGSGVDLVRFGFGDSLAAQLLGRFDIVGFDPRGIKASTPLRCFDSNASADEFYGSTPWFPYAAAEQENEFFSIVSGLAAQCLGQRQPIASHMSTADVVRDLDLLRRAVGDDALNYLGFSYGSFIGNTYANLFPDHVRALVIDGVLDPRLWSSGAQFISDRVATQAEFAEFLRLCDEAAGDCALGGPSGAAARYSALADALRSTPLILDDGSAYTYDVLISDTTSAMYSPEFWGGPSGFGALFAALAAAALGDASARTQAGSVLQALTQLFYPVSEEYENGNDAYYGNHCSDAEYPESLGEYGSIGSYAQDGSPFGPYWWWSSAGCAGWPVASDRYTGPWSAETSAPVLVVGNFFDGVTDYAGAVVSSELLANSRLLSYAGWGHTAFDRSSCVTDYVVDYLLDGSLPPENTVCPANPNPFVPPAAPEGTPEALTSGVHAPFVGLPRFRR